MERKAMKVLACAVAGVAMAGGAVASGQVQGPSSSQTPYVVPVAPGVQTLSLLTVGDSVNNKPDGNPYRMVGIPDGLGAFANGDGTFTLLMNHELGATAGAVRAHGTRGSFVSQWRIDATTKQVLNGQDLIQTVAGVPGGAAPLGRLCSADLPEQTAFFNLATGKGTTERIFMNGEEVGAEGRAFGTVVSTNTAYYLPDLGKFSWENSVASPFAQDKTVVIGLDDSTPGQLYVYVGEKQTTGNPIQKAGLTGGNLYGIKTPVANEISAGASSNASGPATLVDLTAHATGTGANLNAQSITAGVTDFARPEDGAWDPSRPTDFYWVNTGATGVANRLYRMRFNDIANPAAGGQVDLLFQGTSTSGNNLLPFAMDNLGIVKDKEGKTHILIQEDPGNSSRIAKIWQYTVETGNMILVAQHDTSRFVTGAPNFLTQDEESSGIIPAFDILGEGWWLLDVQAHYGISGELVEGGQLLAMYVPTTIPEPTALGLLAPAGLLLARRRAK